MAPETLSAYGDPFFTLALAWAQARVRRMWDQGIPGLRGLRAPRRTNVGCLTADLRGRWLRPLRQCTPYGSTGAASTRLLARGRCRDRLCLQGILYVLHNDIAWQLLQNLFVLDAQVERDGVGYPGGDVALGEVDDRPAAVLATADSTLLIVDGTLVPTRDHTIAEQSKNYRYSTNHQVMIDADTRLVGVVGRPLPGNRADCKAWEESGAKAAIGKTTTIADGGYPGTGLVMPHRPHNGEELPDWKQAHNKSHRGGPSGAGSLGVWEHGSGRRGERGCSCPGGPGPG
ncbi:hypothetical protein Stube_69050 [Streptomyces tubercidicus]|uniref:Transposase IS4-like domain-containing protein n=1 Tax=Streptomyces tubercidicus TaxID=47759 RepID=A0A640V3Q1_9ACTN|nr:hypothetical protein Stube_69050 [Streptomyces tubercidicus]